jgi:hypothetical protein
VGFLGENLGVLYSLKLWAGMIPYGIVYVFLGQMCWLLALQKSPPVYISIGTTFLFILSLIWSALLLDVLPTTPQFIGSAFLTVSIGSSIAEIIHTHKANDSLSTSLLSSPTTGGAADTSLDERMLSDTDPESPYTRKGVMRGANTT